MLIRTADVGIGGFIVCGTAPKHVVLRALGPSLSDSGIVTPLPDPRLELRDSQGDALIVNDDWQDDIVQQMEIEKAGLAPESESESAIDAILDPGAYTAIVRGKGQDFGVAVVEVYDLNDGADSKLSNISTRAFVGTNENIVIAGFTLGGDHSGSDQIVVRGIGPTLAMANTLADPFLEIRNSNGSSLRSNDNWQDDATQAMELQDAGLAPSDARESAISISLLPGAYTALLSGRNNGTGIGLVEVYDLGTSAAPVVVTVDQTPDGDGDLDTIEKQHVEFNSVACLDTFRITVHKPSIINKSDIGSRAALEGQTAPIPFTASAADIVAAIKAIPNSYYAYGQFGNLELDRGSFSYFASVGATNRDPIVVLDRPNGIAAEGFTIEFGSLVGNPPRYNTWVAGMQLITISVP